MSLFFAFISLQIQVHVYQSLKEITFNFSKYWSDNVLTYWVYVNQFDQQQKRKQICYIANFFIIIYYDSYSWQHTT